MRSSHPGRRTARLVAALLLLSAVAYTAWVLEVVLSTGLDPVQAYISELAAEDQPLGGLFRATDLVAGLAVLAAAGTALLTGSYGPDGAAPDAAAPDAAAPDAAAPDGAAPDRSAPGRAASDDAASDRRSAARRPGARRLFGRHSWAVAGWAALALFGAATAADSRLPLSCAPTSDEMCAARETAGLVPATHTAHAVTSSLAMLGALGGLIALTVAARCYGWWPSLRRYGPWLLAGELLATGWSLAAIAAFEAGHGTWSLGAGQRLQVVLVALWLAALAASLARIRGGSTATVGVPGRTRAGADGVEAR
ncbi:DUF998 domain-containing protein [Kitasatospora sp. NPDC050463]|uniref:DUF998 domain-containing protein n=1 Tax=Kitasatospora sp. NPDC050463 TaxID=3155786 RepID=UPI0033DB8F1B